MSEFWFPKEHRHYLPIVGAVTGLTSLALGGLLYWIITLPFPQ